MGEMAYFMGFKENGHRLWGVVARKCIALNGKQHPKRGNNDRDLFLE